jgi:hypothetical protein
VGIGPGIPGLRCCSAYYYIASYYYYIHVPGLIRISGYTDIYFFCSGIFQPSSAKVPWHTKFSAPIIVLCSVRILRIVRPFETRGLKHTAVSVLEFPAFRRGVRHGRDKRERSRYPSLYEEVRQAQHKFTHVYTRPRRGRRRNAQPGLKRRGGARRPGPSCRPRRRRTPRRTRLRAALASAAVSMPYVSNRLGAAIVKNRAVVTRAHVSRQQDSLTRGGAL